MSGFLVFFHSELSFFFACSEGVWCFFFFTSSFHLLWGGQGPGELESGFYFYVWVSLVFKDRIPHVLFFAFFLSFPC